YDYDAAGNITAMAHSAGAGVFTNRWTRTFSVATDSNRLASAAVGGTTEVYTYDQHGNLVVMPHLPSMEWDVHDQLRHTDLGGGGQAGSAYEREGKGTRKVVQRQGGLSDERLYLGSLEIFRRSRNGEILLARETLRILDHDRHLALVDTRTAGEADGLAQT